ERPWPPALTIRRSSSGMLPRANCWQTYRAILTRSAALPGVRDGKTLASSSGDATLKLWDAAAGKLLVSMQGHTGDVRSIAWSPDGKTLVSGCTDKTLKLWDAATGKMLASVHKDLRLCDLCQE